VARGLFATLASVINSRIRKNEAVPERVDFSPNASVYDRRHGATLSDEDLDQLWRAAGLWAGADVLDVGAGTGRVAIPLSLRGCNVVALEPARAMLEELRTKAGAANVSLVIGEGARLPLPSGRFHAAVIARLLYLTTDWAQILKEARRVLAVGGCLLHEWGNGQVDEEWVRIREQARSLFEQAGVPSPFHPGVRSETAIEKALEGLGVVREADVVLGSGPSITLREFLRRLTDGELSYTWGVPTNVRTECLPRLGDWSERTFDLDRSIPMPREIRWIVYRKHAA
jgi:SAM-dependent methyltransferase